MLRRLAASALVLAVALAACGGGDDVGLTDNSWQLRQIVDENGVLGDPVTASTATLAFADNQAGGNASCNRYFGPYELDGSSISFGPLGTTLMACPEPLMTQEQAFTAAMQTVDTWSIDGNTLELSADGATLLVFDVISQDLAGSSWTLIAYHDGAEAFTSVALDTEITVTFEEDAVSGSGGCNTYGGAYTTTDEGGIGFGDLFSTERACLEPEGVMEQERRYLEALGLAAAYQIEGDTLEMFADDGLRLLQYTRSGSSNLRR